MSCGRVLPCSATVGGQLVQALQVQRLESRWRDSLLCSPPLTSRRAREVSHVLLLVAWIPDAGCN